MLPMRQPDPMDNPRPGFLLPGIQRGWHVHGTVPITDADHAALDWLMTECPGGLPHWQDFLPLATRWHAAWVSSISSPLPLEATWADLACDPFVRATWWFFLLSAGQYRLWKHLWRIRQQRIVATEVSLRYRITALPTDAWYRQPHTARAWMTAMQDTMTLSDREDLAERIMAAWRIAWWALWPVLVPVDAITWRPWWGLAPWTLGRPVPQAVRQAFAVEHF